MTKPVLSFRNSHGFASSEKPNLPPPIERTESRACVEFSRFKKRNTALDIIPFISWDPYIYQWRGIVLP